MSPKKRSHVLRVGIVGAGNIAQSAHLPALKKMTDVATVVAIADINEERARSVAEAWGIPRSFGSCEAMLDHCELDFVIACVWNAAHEAVSVAALKRGVPVICEKPLASSLESGLRIREAVEEAGVPFMVALCARFDPEVTALKEMIDAGELGEIYAAKTRYLRRRGTPIGWFTNRELSGGGPLIDIGVHKLDATWYLMGRPRPVRVVGQTWRPIGEFKTKGITRWEAMDKEVAQHDTEDAATGLVFFENGATLFLEASWAQNAPAERGTEILGTRGGASLGPLTIYSENAQGYLTDTTLTLPTQFDRYEAELRHFISCVREGQKPLIDIKDALTIQRILDGIYRSAREGREISLED